MGGGGAQPAVAAVKVQDCLWGASKFENRKVGASAGVGGGKGGRGEASMQGEG